ncbi:MAG: sulfatase-like hydrolase/transferase [Verrucomicrobia bacterium]|nr:sulfatase-like hydrolase/transferase [Verrucomicrobiota bacterium]
MPLHLASGFCALLVIQCHCWIALPAAAPTHPNIVVILADDQGWGDLSLNGNSNLNTPNIDSLATSGAQFEHFFVSPVCSPTRAEFLTGRYHPRGGVRGVTTGAERLNLDETTIADTFQAAGYTTGAFGKWHNGSQYPYHPNGRGFDTYYGFTSGHWGNYFNPILEQNGHLMRGTGFIADDLTDHAMAFIETHRKEPFFCYIPFNTPHSPMQVPDRFYDRFKGAELKQRNRDPKREDPEFTRAALAMCENIDWNVGRILHQLEVLGLTENTIVVYFSDNGPNSWRWNGGMKGRKGSTDEGGVRSPLLVRWPGNIPAGIRISQIAGAIDLLPTLADLAGVRNTGTKPLDGITLKPLLTGSTAGWPDRMIFSHWSGRVSVRTQQHRLDSSGLLFDMVNDPGQTRDVSEALPAEAERLRKSVADWKEHLLPGFGEDPRPLPVGFPAFPVTQLPARDGLPHGKVTRSARAPNSSYFMNWTDTADRMTWDVDIATTGRYEAVLFYACPAADVGAKFELRLNDATIEGTVSEPHDPPLQGSENDRVPRAGESYVKDFKPMRIGTLDLKKGRGELTLRALQIPGSQVMEVRMLLLTLVP